MNFWTFICTIIIIGAAGDALKKAFQVSRSKKNNDLGRQKIDELTRRIDELEKQPDIKNLEQRIQTLETIVVDSDYILDMKFKRSLG